MGAAENVRSFWAAKASTDSPNVSVRPREGRTMEGLRSTLESSPAAQASQDLPRVLPARPVDVKGHLVRHNIFVERDRNPSPATSPTFGRKSPFAKEIVIDRETSTASRSISPILPRSISPHKSSFASPEPVSKGSLSRSKSVTFNEALEVRHMSDCSFDEASSPVSAAYDQPEEDFSEDELLLEAEDLHSSSWRESGQDLSILRTEEIPIKTTPRALPAIPGTRPLPLAPKERATSPETRVMATEQEETRKNISGLGLHISGISRQASGIHDQLQPTGYSADEAKIQVPPEIGTAEGDALNDCIDHPPSILGQDISPPVNKASANNVDLRLSRTAKSPEPAISRAVVREKLAQRKAAQDLAHKEKAQALTPHNSLAPPLPHYESFVKLDAHGTATVLTAPESPLSDASDVEGPQRKVSDISRPITPVEQIATIPQEPQSGRALHHERDKRLSLELSQSDVPLSPPLRTGFTAISYDGDDYGNCEDESADDLIIHSAPSSDCQDKSSARSKEENSMMTSDAAEKSNESIDTQSSPLQHLPNIPELPTRKIDASPPSTPSLGTFDMRHMSLSLDFDNLGTETLGLEQYMTPENHPETPITSRTVAPMSPTKSGSSSLLNSWVDTTNATDKENSTLPEPATITARGLKLRTRPSITPADATALAARRRQVSLEVQAHVESPTTKPAEQAVVTESELSPTDMEILEDKLEEDVTAKIQPMSKPVLQPLSRELSFSDINNAFDRVMQKQKKGYVIRQQTQIVYATAHHEETESKDHQNDSSLKGHTRQSSSVYTTLSQMSGKSNETSRDHRRQGSKIPIGVQMSPRPRAMTNESLQIPILEKLDGGRLFIRVMYVKNLTLPIPKGEEAYFTCTLDNGKHCVTTPKHTLGTTTKINQEFELIADHDLEFILTLQAQYVPPTMPTRPKSTLGRLLNSPKKHKPSGSITSLSLAGYVSDNGSFARAHLALKHFRNRAFGRPYTMLVPILNEWAVETTGMTSKSVPQTRVRKPYKIGNIELQVLYVPPVEAEHRAALPTSLSQAVRDVRDAEWHNQLHCEGYLSQQGGDCPYWRRRHFKLVGSKLTAYHANTGQVRATINLTKATQVTDDKESLTAPEVTVGKGEHKSRRKSGFAEREEGHLYVAEGFRIRFANGELIDFYADSLAEKERWIKILRGIVQKIPVAKAWCQTVLEFEASRVRR